MNSTGYNILEYGAVPGGSKINTKAVQAAVDACAENGGGRVLVPAGTFLTGTIFLKDNVELHLAAGAVLKGSPDLADYNADDCIPQNRVFAAEQVTGGHLIIAAEVRNVSITGPGTIDGNVFAFLDGFSPSDSWNGHDSWGRGGASSKRVCGRGRCSSSVNVNRSGWRMSRCKTPPTGPVSCTAAGRCSSRG